MIQISFSAQELLQVVKNPALFGDYAFAPILALSLKIAILLILLLYVVFAFFVYIQARRLNKWLRSLSKTYYSKLMLAHLILAILGWLLALIIL